jgi:hypothetical protein
MKIFRPVLVIVAAALINIGISGYGLAFHEGGVAHCDGCHTMHNSQDGAVVAVGGNAEGNAHLLVGSDASSVCLSCHRGFNSYHIASDQPNAVNYTAGGDFKWIVPDYTLEVGWTSLPVSGDAFGHNIVAADFTEYVSGDGTHTVAPGGTYPASELGCTSCHDPHGTKDGVIVGSGSYGDLPPTDPEVLGNYRLLGDSNYDAPSTGTTTYAFVNDAPIAFAENGGFADPTTNFYSKRVLYGSGMSEWCGNCHGDFANKTVLGDHKHPAGDSAGLGDFAGNYNSYVATGDTSGTDNYDGLVPIEFGFDQTAIAGQDPANPPGAAGDSNVMCLTCHRAHAGGFRDAGRWDFNSEVIGMEHHPTSGDGGYFPSDPDAGFYYNGASINIATQYNSHQRSLCNKCHLKD